MKHLHAFLLLAGPLIAVVVVITAAVAGKWEAIEHLPGQTPITVLVEERPRTYFRVTPEKSLIVRIEGPARLRVVSRLELPQGARQVVSYSLRVTEGGKELDRHDTESSASSQVRDPGGKHVIGKSRRMSVDIPAGTHVLSLSVEGAPALLVRLHHAAPALGEEATVTLMPIEAPRSVTLQEGEKTIPYHSVLPGRPVKLRVVGPTTLDLLTRLDFDDTMRGTQTYRLRLSERGRLLRELEFKTNKATTATYADLADRVPSKFDRVRLPIRTGLHEIMIELLSPPRGSAEIHARIPQPTTGRQE